jgi:carboxylesterase 2
MSFAVTFYVNYAVTLCKGVPFATPPTGDARWTALTSPSLWTETLNALCFVAHLLKFSLLAAKKYRKTVLYIRALANTTSTLDLLVMSLSTVGKFEDSVRSVLL